MKLKKKSGKSTSLKHRIKYSYLMIIFIMIIPTIYSTTVSQIHRHQYDSIITNVSRANSINLVVKNEIPNELWDLVSGRKNFVTAKQYELLGEIRAGMIDMMRTTDDETSLQKLEVAYRCLQTLYRNVDLLGEQIQQGASVVRNEMTLDEIRSITSLFSEIMQDFIVQEIESASQTNHSINRSSMILMFIQILIVVAAIIISSQSYSSVLKRVQNPIQQIKLFTSEIAEGNLSAKLPSPKVEEYNQLAENLNSMAYQIELLLRQNIQEQKNLQKAEMKALQAQITPHFLYNTFDTIIWLAEAERTEDVIQITTAFSSFLRTSLSRGHEWITVKQEADHVRNYLTIQKIRYAEILNWELEIDESLENFSMLKLCLQPLVENAIYHGIKNKRGRGHIKVTGKFKNDLKKVMVFSVEDDGAGFSQERLEEVRGQLNLEWEKAEGLKSVYGLYNVNKRLLLYYNSASAGIKIESEAGHGAKVYFEVPCKMI